MSLNRETKRIDHFPRTEKFTPYQKSEFDEKTKKNCSVLKNGITSMFSSRVCKVIILGDLCVGKTSLLNRFCHKVFETDYKTTIGVDFQTEEIDILGAPFHLQIWDTAGQERFKCIAQCYYRRAHVIMLVFELSSLRTLISCKNWLREAMEAAAANPEILPYIFLIGTKKDLLSPEACKNVEELAEKTAKDLEAEFWSVSSKTGENVDELFHRAASLVFDDLIANSDENSNKIQIGSDLISFKKNSQKRKNDFSNKCNGARCANGAVSNSK